MRLLELLSFAPLSAPQLAAALHAQPRTVRRVLARLVEDGYVTCRETGRRRQYEPTMRIVAIAGQTVENSRLGQIGRPHVELLHARTAATAHLMVTSYRSVLCVLHAGEDDPDVHPRVRELVPAHATASGKALLAWRDSWRESVLGVPLDRYTSSTVVDPLEVRRVLEHVREDGYATEDSEYQAQVRAVAVPVLVGDQALAALCVSGRGLELAAVAPVVRQAAQRLTDDLDRDR